MRTSRRCKTMAGGAGALILAVLALPGAVAADTGTDPAHKYAWGENAGWVSALSADHDFTIHYDEETGGWLAGHAWGENIGWIVMGSAGGGPYSNRTAGNWGVNLAANGELSGYAWGENIGWINFDHADCDVAIDTGTGEFSGHAWGENIGWIRFKGEDPAYGVRTLAFPIGSTPGPGWWHDHAVLVTNNVSTNDYAACNAGQLKAIATAARDAMDSSIGLDSEAGANVNAIVNGFGNSHNYVVVNLGQVKYVAQPFYDRLIEVGRTNQYPWAAAAATNDHATANIGQVKHVFSFELSGE